MFVYYDSKTGNVQRFIDKIKKERPVTSMDLRFIDIVVKGE